MRKVTASRQRVNMRFLYLKKVDHIVQLVVSPIADPGVMS